MSFWMESELGPCATCRILLPCRKQSRTPLRGHCFDCQREFVFLRQPEEDPVYPTLEGSKRCLYAIPTCETVWCSSCKQELEDLVREQQVPITPEVLKLG